MIFLPLFLSLRINNKKHCGKITQLNSVISTISITLAIASLIICSSAINGFEYELNYRILSVIPHFEIENINEPISNWKNKIKSIKKIADITQVIPYIKFNGLLEKGNKFKSIQIKGIDYKIENKFSNIKNFLINKKNFSNFESGKKNIILGNGIAKLFNIKVNDWVTILVIDNLFNKKNIKKIFRPKIIRLHVNGILKFNSLLDYNLVLLPIEDAQKILNIGNKVTGIACKIKNPFQVKVFLKNNIKNINFNINNWIDKYGYIYHDIKMIKNIVYLTMILVIIISCFNIISTLFIKIKNKIINIIILKNLGATNTLVSKIFILYGLITCLYSILIGSLLGILISLNLTNLVKLIEHLFHRILLSENIYFINFLPSKLNFVDIFLIIIMVFIISLLSCWYPIKYINNINYSVLNKK